MDLYAELVQKRSCHCTGGNTRRRFTRGGPLKHPAHIVSHVLECAREVGVPGYDTRVLFSIDLWADRTDIHRALPVGEVLVLHRHSDRGSERLAVAHAAANLSEIGLNLHSAAATITPLAPCQLLGYVPFGEWNARRDPFDNNGQSGTM
jgi:hypothetical protein